MDSVDVEAASGCAGERFTSVAKGFFVSFENVAYLRHLNPKVGMKVIERSMRCRRPGKSC